MGRVIYFNINYICNNRCLFCFSSSTSTQSNSGIIPYQECVRRLATCVPSVSDLVIINGGEPTLHPQFYQLLNYLNHCYTSRTVIYTNGVSLDASRISHNSKVHFVIPIHGPESIHTDITRNPASFRNTLTNLHTLNHFHFSYSLKFIINNQMIATDFHIKNFLLANDLHPLEVIIARMNETKTSQKNHYRIPEISDVQDYMNRQINILKSYVPIKILDIPPCLITNIENNINMRDSYDVPQFFFNDFRFNMRSEKYYKQVKIKKICKNCHFEQLCTLMSTSYLTLVYRDGWEIDSE